MTRLPNNCNPVNSALSASTSRIEAVSNPLIAKPADGMMQVVVREESFYAFTKWICKDTAAEYEKRTSMRNN
jgi:hypothetical protein